MSNDALRKEARSENTSPERLKALADSGTALARIVARNNAVPSDLLEELGSHQDRSVRRAVASNPSTPAETAAKLGGQFPNELLDNPAFDFYLLERPDLLEGIGKGALRSLLKRELCPESFFAYAAKTGERATQLAVLTNASAPKAVVEQLMASEHDDVREAASMHVALAGNDKAEEWRERFNAALASSIESGGKSRAAHDALAHFIIVTAEVAEDGELHLDEAEHALLATARADWTERVARLSDETLGDAERARLAKPLMRRRTARLLMAARRSTPPWLLRQLARDHDFAVRLVLLTYNSDRLDRSDPVSLPEPTDSDLEGLIGLAPSVKARIALSPHTPPRVLAQLARDKDEKVADAARANVNVPLEILVAWEPTSSSRGRAGVAYNSATPPETLARLAKKILDEIHKGENRYWYFDRRALLYLLRNPNTPPNYLDMLFSVFEIEPEYYRYELLYLAGNASISLDMLIRLQTLGMGAPVSNLRRLNVQELAKSSEPNLRKAAARHPDADADLLSELATDSENSVRIAAAKNPAMPSEVLAKLAENADVEMADTLLDICKSPALRRRILAGLPLPTPGAEGDDRYGPDSRLRWTVASDPLTPPDRLEALAEWCPEEVAGNPATPEHVLRALYQGVLNRYVHRAMEHGDEGTASELARNAATPVDVLEHMAQRRFMEGSYVFRTGPYKGVCFMRAYQAIPFNTSAPEDLRLRLLTAMAQMAKGKRFGVDQEVAARNPHTPKPLLARLSRDKDDRVREAAALNPCTPEDALSRLAKDENEYVREAATRNKRTPREKPPGHALNVRVKHDVVLDVERALKVAAESGSPVAIREMRKRLVSALSGQTTPSTSRLLALMLPEAPPEALAKAQRSPSWLDRCAVAIHANTPTSAIIRLAKDGNAVVRSAALGRLADLQIEPAP